MYLYGLVFAVMFFCVYGGSSFLTSLHEYRVNLSFGFESHIPLLSQFSLAYASVGVLLVFSPFLLPKDTHFIPFFKLVSIQLLIASAFFIVMPLATLEYAAPNEGSFINNVFLINDKLNLDHNYFPSLHVTFALTLALFIIENKSKWLKWVFMCWVIIVSASTLFTKQHYIIDVAGGIALGAISYYYLRKNK